MIIRRDRLWAIRGSAFIGFALAYGFAPGPRADAHALLWRSVPDRGAMLQRAPDTVTLTFTEPPERTFSAIHVLDRTGRPVEPGAALAVPGQPLALRVPLNALPDGIYTVTWRTVSRVDGHVAGGTFEFGVGAVAAASAEDTSPRSAALYVVSRVMLYAGVIGLMGMALARISAGPQRQAGVPSSLWGFWALAAAGVALLGLGQASDAGTGLGRLLGTPLGRALWWRALPVAAAGPAIAIAQRSPRYRWSALVVLSGLPALAMMAHVVAGHAAAGSGLRQWLAVLEQWVHFGSIGMWAGALLALLATARTAPGDAAAARFCSLGAASALGAAAVMGALRALEEVGSWPGLFSTEFGRLVLVKTGLFLLLALLGAGTRRLVLSRSSTGPRRLQRVVGAELTVAAAILAVTALMTGLALPGATSGAARTASELTLTGSDYATSVRVRLTITPGRAGVNRFTAEVTDYDTRRRVVAGRVTLRFEKPDQPGIAPSNLPLSRTREGLYQGRGTNLSLDGAWSVDVVVERQNEIAEVPLRLTISTPPEQIRTIRVPGKAPVYTSALSGGRTLTISLEPGAPGLNALHTTFTDAAGRELEIARAPKIMLGRKGETPRAIAVLQEGPGHFYGDVELDRGDWQFSITAITRAGETLSAHLSIHL